MRTPLLFALHRSILFHLQKPPPLLFHLQKSPVFHLQRSPIFHLQRSSVYLHKSVLFELHIRVIALWFARRAAAVGYVFFQQRAEPGHHLRMLFGKILLLGDI